MTTIPQRIDNLRAAMHRAGLDAWIIPSSDPHQSEYVADHWKSRTWYSGFTGSAGTLVVTANEAGLWTDSRYFLQAERQLEGTGITLFRALTPGVPDHTRWLMDTLCEGDAVGIDGWVLSINDEKNLRQRLDIAGIRLETGLDLSGASWTGRPALPATPIFAYPMEFAGKSRRDKLAEMRDRMEEKGASAHLFCTLDDIAWVLNLRGSDVDCNPTFYAYLLLEQAGATLYIDPVKLPEEIKVGLAHDGVESKPYHLLLPELASLAGTILLDPAATSVRLQHALSDSVTVLMGETLSILPKSTKNPTEVALLRKTMVKDGVALLRLFRWLEARMDKGEVTEWEVSEQLRAFRADQPHYVTESFPAIAGYGPNGAVVHYRPEESGSAVLRREGIFLLDSGGQYLDGTTDVTRTVALGPATPAQRRAATMVLKGHIALATVKFPYGIGGFLLDTLARVHLWQDGLDYGHGTGHGVGFFLNVHEGPQSIRGAASGRAIVRLEPGMVTSNEPGYYKEGEFGVRIENLILCIEAERGPSGRFLAFETLTLFPIDRNLIEETLLSPAEKEWLNAYHARVERELSPQLDGAEKEWLAARCRPIA